MKQDKRRAFLLSIEYDGSRYYGWQVQKDVKTIQGILLEKAYQIFETKDVELQGAGRTDRGVHALSQTAHLKVAANLKPAVIQYRFNDLLPSDINILDVRNCSPNFHARHDAKARSYVYQISKRRTALNKNFVWWVKDKLDVSKMRRAITPLQGSCDMSAFTDDTEKTKSGLIMIFKAELTETDDLLILRITASHFLQKMVRKIVMLLVEIGRGNQPPDAFSDIIQNKKALPFTETAPPSGLFLEKIYYALPED